MADTNQDQKLSVEEFCIAMFLVNCRINGEELPETLPESLVPTKPRNQETAYTAIPRYKGEQGGSADAGSKTEDPKSTKRDLSDLQAGKNTGSGPSVKICIVGDQCGKTSLVTRFLFDEFQENVPETVEDKYEYNYKFDGKECHIRILDTSGNEFYYDSMHDKWFSGTDGFIFLYSVASMNSYKALESFRHLVMSFTKDDRIPAIVVGTQIDKEQRQVTREEGMWWSSRNGLSWIECSAKSGQNVEEVFKTVINKILAAKQKGIQSVKKPHKWKKTNFSGATACRHCNKLIGLVFKNGYQCEVCKVPIHKQCMDQVNSNCGSVATHSPISSRKSLDQTIRDVVEDELYVVLKDDHACAEFRNFLEKRGAGAPHVSFWTAVEEYKSLINFFERRSKGVLMYNSFFFKTNAMFDLKIPEKVLKALKANITGEKYEQHIFNQAQQAVYQQIKQQFFPEFIKANLSATIKEQVKSDPESDIDDGLGVFVKDDLIDFLDNFDPNATAAISTPQYQKFPPYSPPTALSKSPDSLIKQTSNTTTSVLAAAIPPQKHNDDDHEEIDADFEPDSEIAKDLIEKKPLVSNMKPPVPVKALADQKDGTHYGEIPVSKDWYLGSISRVDAEKLLLSCGGDVFLVRTSSVEGCYALSKYFTSTKSFIHFIIAPTKGGYGLKDCGDDTKSYESLDDLIANSPVTNGFTSVGKFSKKSP
eukprot:TRINITY_DN2222_c0_g1_i1.p1 TRINITY_DN2222_c0_g1~~TRINITY_DN2222_c0_g1_i1.p1  ORF type:complete len:799 (-),score=216.79 TRINITY_DN2222_c0_g1_i1:869-2980(-)